MAPTPRNHLLRSLSRDDFASLERYLEPVTLGLRERLEIAHNPVAHVFFVESGIVSVVAVDAQLRSIEAGIIGPEGMTGLPVMLGDGISPNETFVQVAGHALRIEAVAVREAMQKSPTLRDLFLRFVHTFMVQTAQTALANGRDKVEERLARWVLMAHDRLASDDLPLTHEFLAIMLGVRRAGVTVALHDLEGRALIRSTRGLVIIRDREGLEELASGSYGSAEAELSRLLGKDWPRRHSTPGAPGQD